MEAENTDKSHRLLCQPRTSLYVMHCVASRGGGQQISAEKIRRMVSLVSLCHTMNEGGEGVPFSSNLMLSQWPEAWGLSIQQTLDCITADLAFLEFL